MGVRPEERAIFAVLRVHGPLPHEQVIARVVWQYRFDAALLLPRLIDAGKIAVVNGSCHIPGPTAALAALRAARPYQQS